MNHQSSSSNPFVGALGIHVPVILGEPQIKDRKEMARQETGHEDSVLWTRIFRWITAARNFHLDAAVNQVYKQDRNSRH